MKLLFIAPIPEYEKESILYACNAYSFLAPFEAGCYQLQSLEQLSGLLRGTYDMSDVRHKYLADLLLKHSSSVAIQRPPVATWGMNNAKRKKRQ